MDARSHKSVNKELLDEWLDSALEQSFPASDPIPSFRGEPQVDLTSSRLELVKSDPGVDSTPMEAGHEQHGRGE
jgi:hypothetical protein